MLRKKKKEDQVVLQIKELHNVFDFTNSHICINHLKMLWFKRAFYRWTLLKLLFTSQLNMDKNIYIYPQLGWKSLLIREWQQWTSHDLQMNHQQMMRKIFWTSRPMNFRLPKSVTWPKLNKALHNRTVQHSTSRALGSVSKLLR